MPSGPQRSTVLVVVIATVEEHEIGLLTRPPDLPATGRAWSTSNSGTSPERFVPAYRWHSGPSGQFATEVLPPERFVAAVQAAARRFLEGPVFALSGVGRERWASVASELGLPGHPQGIAMSLAGAGTTAASLIRDALGPAASRIVGCRRSSAARRPSVSVDGRIPASVATPLRFEGCDASATTCAEGRGPG